MNNSTENCSMRDVDVLVQSLELVIYIPIFVFGLVLNVIALWVFCRVLKKWTESSIYMTNLAILDLLLLFQLPFKMHATNNKWSPDKNMLCSFLETMYFLAMYGSIYIIVCISVDRYIAICHPFHAKRLRSKKTARIVCATIWAVVVLATIPVYTFHREDPSNLHCFHRFSDKRWHPALITCVEVFGFLLPALVLISCSVLSIRALRDTKATSPQSPERKAGIRIIYSGLCAFLVPFTPCHIAIFFQVLVRSKVITECQSMRNISLFLQLALHLANVTCCLDAICYYFIVEEVRASRDVIKRSIQRITSFSVSET
ncbi:G-protein coupled receptor 55 [Trichomycterus rosablanca]|uniref:G-protein coupled receptor 55 n=1 Tax=Trichomycterus rosablanca TaxID=2290929 RepID=UPI002F3562BD